MLIWPLLLITASCATDIQAHAQPVALVEEQAGEVYRLRNEVALELVIGRVRRPLPAGSRWKAIGTIPEGNVFKPLDHLLQVHTGHSYEAFLVCSEGKIIGVYLPVEDSFVAARATVPILLEVNE
jgi:hypothetical protein